MTAPLDFPTDFPAVRQYLALPTEVVDGDTMHMTVDLGWDIYINDTIRLYGINCPELRTPEGVTAKSFATQWVTDHASPYLVLQTIKDKREKYGRMLGIILSHDLSSNLNQLLVESGNAVVYLPK